MKCTRTTAVGILLAGVMIGYIIGLWQKAAQIAHRDSCTACREFAEVPECRR